MNLPERIRQFFESHHVFVLATALDDRPHACSLFYVLDPDDPALVFASSLETRHGFEMSANPEAAGALYQETRAIDQIRGLQFGGTILQGTSEAMQARYTAAFPEAANIKAPFWTFRLNSVKMIDNSRGFGAKEIWSRQ